MCWISIQEPKALAQPEAQALIKKSYDLVRACLPKKLQAAIAALSRAGVQPPTPRYWSHDFVLREYCVRLAREGGDYAPSVAERYDPIGGWPTSI